MRTPVNSCIFLLVLICLQLGVSLAARKKILKKRSVKSVIKKIIKRVSKAVKKSSKSVKKVTKVTKKVKKVSKISELTPNPTELDNTKLDVMFYGHKKLVLNTEQKDELKLTDIGKYGCFGYWFQFTNPEKATKPREMTAITIDRENGKKVRLKFFFQKGKKDDKFGFENDMKNGKIKILTRDFTKEIKKDDWMYVQICIDDKGFKPYLYFPKKSYHLFSDTYTPLGIGSAYHATAYFCSDGASVECHGKIYFPFYTRRLLLDGLRDLHNFGLPFNHLIVDMMRTPLSDYNNLKNFALEMQRETGSDTANKIQVNYGTYNGTHYNLAEGEFSEFYPDIKLKDDNIGLSPNKNAIIAKGVYAVGVPPERPTFRMNINIRVNIRQYYQKALEREYETDIPPLYTWQNKDQEVLMRCFPNFKTKLGTNKTEWFYDNQNQLVNCYFTGSDLAGEVVIVLKNTGEANKYFVNVVIQSSDGRNLLVYEPEQSQKPTMIKMAEGQSLYPKIDDMHIFGDIKERSLQEPSPFIYDYELINIHTGYAGERLVLETKRGYEFYKIFANGPILTLGENGYDAIGCKGAKSASFFNGKNFACLKYASADVARKVKLTAETDKVTANYFKDFSCARHKYLETNKRCSYCIFNCDVCSEKGLCDVCSMGFSLSGDKKKCMFCKVDQIYDTVTKSCITRVPNSDKLMFSPFKKAQGKKLSVSQKFHGPGKMGKMTVMQGQIFLKSYNLARNKMYELNTDPNYPDDNIE